MQLRNRQVSYVGLKPNGNNAREVIVHSSKTAQGAILATSNHNREVRKYLENQDQGGYGQFPPAEDRKKLAERFKAFLPNAIAQLHQRVEEKFSDKVRYNGTTISVGALFSYKENGVQKYTAVNAALGDTRFAIIEIPDEKNNEKINVMPVYTHSGSMRDEKEQALVKARHAELKQNLLKREKELLSQAKSLSNKEKESLTKEIESIKEEKNILDKIAPGFVKANGDVRLFDRHGRPGANIARCIGDTAMPCAIREPDITSLTFEGKPNCSYYPFASTDGGLDGMWDSPSLTDAEKLEFILNKISSKNPEEIISTFIDEALERKSNDDCTAVIGGEWLILCDGHGKEGHEIARFIHDEMVQMIAEKFPSPEEQAKKELIDRKSSELLDLFRQLSDSQQDDLLRRAKGYQERNNATPVLSDYDEDDLPSFGEEEKVELATPPLNRTPSLVLASPPGVQTRTATRKMTSPDTVPSCSLFSTPTPQKGKRGVDSADESLAPATKRSRKK